MRNIIISTILLASLQLHYHLYNYIIISTKLHYHLYNYIIISTIPGPGPGRKDRPERGRHLRQRGGGQAGHPAVGQRGQPQH